MSETLPHPATVVAPPKRPAPAWQAAFLAALRRSGQVAIAAREARIQRQHLYRVRAASPALAVAWQQALDEAGVALAARAVALLPPGPAPAPVLDLTRLSNSERGLLAHLTRKATVPTPPAR